MSRILISNGLIVTAERSFPGSVLVENGKISGVEKGKIEAECDHIIEAGGLYVIPGAIDPHVHLELETPGGFSADDFYTGTKAAIAGGATTIIDFVTPHRDQSLIEALEQRKATAQKSLIDYSLHMSITNWNEQIAIEAKKCIEREGISSFKLYLAYQDTIGIESRKLAMAMESIGEAGGMALLHCEDDALINHLQKKYISEGKISPAFHPLSRPPEAETTAVLKAISYSKLLRCPLYIVHVSVGHAVDLIAQAREDGLDVYGETCPQYLLLDDSVYQRPFEQSAKFVMSPPLRTGYDKWKLWKAIKDGAIQSIGTDHCPFNLKGQKDRGIDNFTKIPNGAGGIEHRPALLFTHGVLSDRISLNRWVELISTNPAKIFGLSHCKGDLKPGLDADIVVWDPKHKSVISAASHHQNCDSNVFEGFKTQGAPRHVIAGGKVVYSNGNFLLKDVKSRFLKRST
jgi:dihydropyrimidinase